MTCRGRIQEKRGCCEALHQILSLEAEIIWRELDAATGQGTPSSSDEEVGAMHTPLTRSATTGTGVEHQSLPYKGIRGPKKTVRA